MKSSTAFTQHSPAKLALWALLSIILTNSCSDPATVGIELAPGNNQIGTFFEEFELPAEVVLIDSFNTTKRGNLVVGIEQDEYFGRTEASGYTRLHVDVNKERPTPEAFLDSMFFDVRVISVDGENLDEGKTLNIHRLTEPILDTAYYSFDKLMFEENPIATGEFTFGEVKDTIISLPLNEEFREDFFGKMKRGLEFQDLFLFREYFPGVAFKGKEGDNTTLGIALNTDTKIATYYHYPGDTASTLYEVSTAVSSGASSRYFTGIESDRTGTPTSVVTETSTTYSTGSKVGLKAGLGLMLKLNTSPIDSFLDTLPAVTFNQVNILIGEVDEYPEGQAVPQRLSIYFTDDSNQFIENGSSVYFTVQADGQPQVFTNEDGNEVPNVGAPTSINFDAEKGSYNQLITSYLNAIYRGKLTRKDWLVYGGFVSGPTASGQDPFRQSLRQFIVDKNKIKLQVIYSKIR